MTIATSKRTYRPVPTEGLSLSVRHIQKFHLKRAGQYLHWSAKMMTANRADAWSGTERQAINCIVKFPAAKGCSPAGLD